MTVKTIEISLKNGDIKAYGYQVENAEKTLILVHGMGEYVGRYRRFIKKFNEAGISVFALDQRGHGHSVGPQGHCAPREEVLSDLDCLIEETVQRAGNTGLYIYGHSMGGNVVLDYRRRGKYRFDLKGYILSAPWVVLVRKVPLKQKIAVRIAAKILPKKIFSFGKDENSREANMNKLGYKKDPLSHHVISYQCAVDGFEIADSLYKGQGIEDASKAPMLLMHGTDDKMCHLDGSRKIAENEGELCELVIWQDRGHDLHRGKTAKEGNAVIAKVISWINERKNTGDPQVSKVE